MKLLISACMLLGVANALPRYIAVPADQIQFLDLAALQAHSRLPRQAAEKPQHDQQYEANYEPQQPYYGVQAKQEDAAPAASGDRPSRHSHHEVGDFVDFGAHTGNNGAFGWYSDYPITGGH